MDRELMRAQAEEKCRSKVSHGEGISRLEAYAQ